MARPREFDERAVLDAAVQCFWSRGYGSTSVRDLIEGTGLTGASLYNAFGDKRALYERALEHYIEESIADRIRRCEALPPMTSIEAFFQEVIRRSLADKERKGCMLVNAALDVAPHDPGFQKAVSQVLMRIESFFMKRVERGQADGTINSLRPARSLARHLLSVLMGIRVLARIRPERALLEDAVVSALVLLIPTDEARDGR